ncbi:MAG: hypothetical protein A2W26_06125 [Acidobacteria bacterium RBG_16_64_8]|nr:MAG: hypothetical protein A2W26_06125 [Acidobacteria bacterium RBG_16_64_8]
MGRFLLRRLAYLVLVLLGTTAVVFALSYVAPADPARAALGLYASEESVARYRAEHGLNRPLPIQYAVYLTRLLSGDLGISILSGRPVIDDLRKALPATLELIVPSLIFAVVVGIGLGALGALKANRWQDTVARLAAVFGMSMPVFWLGVVLQLILFGRLGWLPIGGRLPHTEIGTTVITGLVTVDALLAGRLDLFLTALRHLVLPAFTLSLVNLATLARITRSALLDVLHQPYVQVAYSKGLTRSLVVRRHAFPNAMIPLITLIGLMIGRSLGGAVIVETIFSWPGIGRQVVGALIQLDVPVVAAFALLMGVAYGIANMLVDVSYFVIDPRVRYQ